MSRLKSASFQIGRREFLALPLLATGGEILGAPAVAGRTQAGVSAPKPLSKEERMRLVVFSNRTFESGFHMGPTVRFDKLDPEQYMEEVRKADTEVVVIETKSHWGYAYYNTKVGTRHPNLNYDLIARLVEAGHRQGLSVVAYYSGQVDMQSALKHPEWISRNPDGSLAYVNQFIWCCHHSGYGDYARGMYQEIFSQYDFDGLFIDGVPYPRWVAEPMCHCQWCEKKYDEDVGGSFLDGLDTPEGYRKRLDWFKDAAVKYLVEVHRIVRSASKQPDLPIWYNQTSPFDMSTKVLKMNSCLYTEPVDSPTGLSVGALVLRAWGMPGPQVGFFWPGYNLDPVPTDKFRTAAGLLQNVRPRFITDHQNMPDGRMRPEFWEWCGMLQSDVNKVEVHLQNLEPILSLGMVFSEPTRDYLQAERKGSLSFAAGGFQRSIIGCAELLTRSQYPVEVIPQWRLNPEYLSQFDMVALPEVESLSETEAQALRTYVEKGGTLLATWKCGLVDELGKKRENFALADVLGVNLREEVTKYAAKDGPGIYFQTNGHRLSSFLGSGEVAILGKGGGPTPTFCPFLTVNGSAESILDFKLPYLVPDIAKHIFQTWNVAPPGNAKIPRAATVNRFGQGQALFVGVPLFQRYQPDLPWIALWVRGLVTRLVPNPPVRVEGGEALHTAFYRQGPKRLVVQMLNSTVWTSRGMAAPLRDLEIVGRSDRFKIGSARTLWPSEKPLRVTPGDTWRVQVPEVALYSVIAIDLV